MQHCEKTQAPLTFLLLLFIPARKYLFLSRFRSFIHCLHLRKQPPRAPKAGTSVINDKDPVLCPAFIGRCKCFPGMVVGNLHSLGTLPISRVKPPDIEGIAAKLT